MQAAVEGLTGPDQDISRSAGAAQGLIGQPTLLSLRGSLIRDDYHEVVIAVGPPSLLALEPNR